MAQGKRSYPTFIKLFIGLWVFMLVNIIALAIYLHSPPWQSNSSENLSSIDTLKSFYPSINQHNTYLNPDNINNESVVYQLLHRILTQNSNDANQPDVHTVNKIVSKFNFELKTSESLCKPSDVKHGCYKIIQQDKFDIINIYGDNIGSLISGLSYYLSTYWMVSISWNGNNINCLLNDEYLQNVIDSQWPDDMIYAARSFQYTYYKNPCTDSYSMVWWDWNRWEKELDWMVLQNINLLLLPKLNELIEYELYTKHFGLTHDELNQYFVGPAFLAWFRMGNLRGWPPFIDANNNNKRLIGLTQHWFKQQLSLTYKIIARCIEFGIDIILPAFSGHVPTAFANKYKRKGNFYDGSRWFGMPNELTHLKFLDATHDFYVDIGLKYQKIQYDILYSFLKIKQNKNKNSKNTIFIWLDQYNELTPKSAKLEYLQKSGENQLKSLKLKEYGNIQIKWIVQGWMFVHMRSFWNNERIKSYFAGIESDNILILDLIAEKGSIAKDSNNFFKHDYIWCFLHNFGGGYGLSGNMQNIFNTLSSKHNKYWKGIGISMEGIHNNPILYHSVLYHSYSHIDVDNNKMDLYSLFIKQYISSRYGKYIFDADSNEILSIWNELIALIYKSSKGKWSVTRSLILKRPNKRIVSGPSEFQFLNHKLKVIDTNINKQKANGFQTTLVDYPVCKLFVIWNKFIIFITELIANDKDKNIVFKSETLSNDIAEITRQILSDLFQQIYLLINDVEVEDENILKNMMLGIIDDIDKILSDFQYFRLDFWINNARKFGKDKQEKDYFELNARNLVTRWGPNGEINDYSSREWNGLMSNYYKMRWKIYFDNGNVNEFEKQWQYQTIDTIINVNKNDYQSDGNYKQFYNKLLVIYNKYSDFIDCNS